RFKCNGRRCLRKSFGRQAELRRHYNSAHASTKRTYWCLEPSCERFNGTGRRAFHRKDKLRDHVRQKHSNIAQ
ncbi:hypothetical protein EK21DRAFT_21974, partial [Setomelanomma holmii]